MAQKQARLNPFEKTNIISGFSGVGTVTENHEASLAAGPRLLNSYSEKQND